MKLKFDPSDEWLMLFGKFEEAARALTSSAKRPVNLQKIFNEIYLDKVSSPVAPLERMLSRASEAQAKQVIDLFMDLWNMTPRSSFGGKTPGQMADSLVKKTPLQRNNPGWTKVMELLLNIQGNFQTDFYSAAAKLKPKQQEIAIAYSHRLFERYLYTLIEDILPDQAAAADLIAGHIEHEGITFPKNTQEQIRVYKTPIKNPAPDARMRTTVGQEAASQFPIISDYLNGRKKSEMYSADLYYNRLLNAVTKRRPETEIQVMAYTWEYAVETWRSSSVSLRKTYEAEEWRAWWMGQFEAASKDWISTDECFQTMIERIHTEVMPMQAAVDQLNAPAGRYIEPQGMEELAAYMMLFDAQVSYARDFISPLVTYLPIIEVRYIDPLYIQEELEYPFSNAQQFVNAVSKPPSYFTLRSPIGRQLWKKIKKELR